MRFDTANTRIISDAGSQRTILLDHVKKEASTFPMPGATPGASVPGMPQASASNLPKPPATQVEDLGKSMIEGHEVEGKRYTLPAMAAPPKPAMPTVPEGSEHTVNAQLARRSQTSVDANAEGSRAHEPVPRRATTYCKPTSPTSHIPQCFSFPPEYKIKSKP
jgi:hypothetical protein